MTSRPAIGACTRRLTHLVSEAYVHGAMERELEQSNNFVYKNIYIIWLRPTYVYWVEDSLFSVRTNDSKVGLKVLRSTEIAIHNHMGEGHWQGSRLHVFFILTVVIGVVCCWSDLFKSLKAWFFYEWHISGVPLVRRRPWFKSSPKHDHVPSAICILWLQCSSSSWRLEPARCTIDAISGLISQFSWQVISHPWWA